MVDMASESATIRRPRRGLFVLEGRAFFELAALLPAYPVLRRAPRGDGHAVLVLPGFLADDFSTRALRGFLRSRGYSAHGWRLGRNLGPNPELIGHLVERFRELRNRSERKLTLIGWSLGGVYARELARNFPSDVRQVITLASPFRDLSATSVPPLLRRFGSRHRPANDSQRAQLGEPIPVPATAIYSKTDGIAAWQSCMEPPGPLSENIEVESSHLGIGHHPVVLLTIADRLAQPEGEWQPFQVPAGWRWPWVPRLAAATPS